MVWSWTCFEANELIFDLELVSIWNYLGAAPSALGNMLVDYPIGNTSIFFFLPFILVLTAIFSYLVNYLEATRWCPLENSLVHLLFLHHHLLLLPLILVAISSLCSNICTTTRVEARSHVNDTKERRTKKKRMWGEKHS